MAAVGPSRCLVERKSKGKTNPVPLMRDSSRDAEDPFQNFRRQPLWRESRCLRIARDFVFLTGLRSYPGAPNIVLKENRLIQAAAFVIATS